MRTSALDDLRVRHAGKNDLARVESLLDGASLPLDGVRSHFENFLVAEESGTIYGAIGMEVYGQTALLRSLVVSEEQRSLGIGSALHDALLTDALKRGVSEVVLLTTTAEQFFARKGFRKVTRETINRAVTSSPEFAGACPKSATVMRRRIGQRILILCTGNACRSQMAAAFLRSFDPWLNVFSAGTHPASKVHPNAMKVMEEMGISLKDQQPRNVDELTTLPFDFVVTVCDDARESCPLFTGTVHHRRHLGFEDPAKAKGSDDAILSSFRAVRDKIRISFKEFYMAEVL